MASAALYLRTNSCNPAYTEVPYRGTGKYSDCLLCNCEGSEQIYYKVVDAAGNVTYKRITITIVDSSFKELPSPEVGIRSVRWQYYNNMNKDADGKKSIRKSAQYEGL